MWEILCDGAWTYTYLTVALFTPSPTGAPTTVGPTASAAPAPAPTTNASRGAPSSSATARPTSGVARGVETLLCFADQCALRDQVGRMHASLVNGAACVPGAGVVLDGADAPACVDTAHGAVDATGDGCAWYASFPSECSAYDDSDFTAELMCCACDRAVAPEAYVTLAPALSGGVMTLLVQFVAYVLIDAMVVDFGRGFARDNLQLAITRDGRVRCRVFVGRVAYDAETGPMLTAGQTVQAVVTMDGERLKLFVDGSFVALNAQVPEARWLVRDVHYLGRGVTPGFSLSGEIHVVATWYRALGADEAAGLAALENPCLMTPTTLPTPGPSISFAPTAVTDAPTPAPTRLPTPRPTDAIVTVVVPETQSTRATKPQPGQVKVFLVNSNDAEQRFSITLNETTLPGFAVRSVSPMTGTILPGEAQEAVVTIASTVRSGVRSTVVAPHKPFALSASTARSACNRGSTIWTTASTCACREASPRCCRTMSPLRWTRFPPRVRRRSACEALPRSTPCGTASRSTLATRTGSRSRSTPARRSPSRSPRRARSRPRLRARCFPARGT